MQCFRVSTFSAWIVVCLRADTTSHEKQILGCIHERSVRALHEALRFLVHQEHLSRNQKFYAAIDPSSVSIRCTRLHEFVTASWLTFESCTYHHAVLELLRPFVPQKCGLDPRFCDANIGRFHLRIVQICSDAARQLRRLLRHHEALFEGFPVDIHFAAAITAVAFDSISFITTHGGNFVGEEYAGLLAALKMMSRMRRAFRVLHFALQGIEHTLSINHLKVPAEVAGILTTSEENVESNSAIASERPKAN